MEALPDDVVLEILVRVTGIRDIFRCAATCRRWRLLIADDDSFLRRRWPEGARHRSSLLGFFSEQPRREERVTAGIIPTPMPPFTPAPWSPFVHHRCRFPDIRSPRRCRAVPLTSRRGLLLVCFIPYGGAIHVYHQVAVLAVSDPLAGAIRLLPPLPLNYNSRSFTIEGCTVLTGADLSFNQGRPRPVSSINSAGVAKVLIISYAEQRYNLHVFSSADSSWGTPIKLFDPLEHGENILPLQVSAAVCQGTAHWLFKDRSSHYTLNVSVVETAHVSLTKLPITPENLGFNLYSPPLLSVTKEGALSLLRLYRRCTGLEIWTRQGGDENGGCSSWHLAKTIRLQRPERSKIGQVRCVCVGEMSGALLIEDNRNCMYIADLEAGTMETVTELFRGVFTGVIPFEVDWPVFFMSRLTAGTVKRTNKLGGARPSVASSLWGRIFGRLSLG